MKDKGDLYQKYPSAIVPVMIGLVIGVVIYLLIR